MAQIHFKIKSCLQKLQKKQQVVYKFFESLLYGKQMNYYNIPNQSIQKTVLYLNESHPQLLISLGIGNKPSPKRIFDIRKIQMRRQNYNFEMDYRLQRNKYLIMKDQDEELILIFPHKEDRDSFILDIQGVSKAFQQIPNMYDPIIVKSFIKADFDQNQQISHQELKKTINLMKMQIKNEQIAKIIKNISKSSQKTAQEYNGSIILAHFQKLWKILFCRYQLIKLFQKYSKNRLVTFQDYLLPLMNKKQLQSFLVLQQKQDEDQIKNIIQKIFINRDAISFYDFSRFIFGVQNQIGYKGSSQNSAKDVKKQKGQKGKTKESKQFKNIMAQQPLNQYYCYSSHNTYLTGNQLTSNSRVERYLIDLQNGFRCVQIDVHDGDDQPVVTHGYTLTSEVTFKQIIEAIGIFSAYNKNHTPIILSLQVHCNVKNQKKMYDILTKEFGKKLILIGELGKNQGFPTLQQCFERIIIKGPGNIQIFQKNRQSMRLLQDQQVMNFQSLQETKQTNKLEDVQFDLQADEDMEERLMLSHLTGKDFLSAMKDFLSAILHQKQQESLPYYKNKHKFQEKILKLNQSKRAFMENIQCFQQLKRKSFKKKQPTDKASSLNKIKLNPQFLSVISMLSKGKLQNQSPWQSISLNQTRILQCYKDDRKKFTQLSKKKWMRSYPDGLRVNSSNYNPICALQMGVQIVALNSQTVDCPFNLLLKVFFQEYSPKMIGYFPKVNLDDNARIKTLSIKFISAMRIYQNDSSNERIPPVQIFAYFVGTQSDAQKNSQFLDKKSYTNIVQKNAFNPIFSQTQSETITIKYRHQKLAFLIIEINGCGRGIIQLSRAKSGYRTIILYDQFYKEKESKVLCHFQTDQFRPEQQTLVSKFFL